MAGESSKRARVEPKRRKLERWRALSLVCAGEAFWNLTDGQKDRLRELRDLARVDAGIKGEEEE